MKLDIDTYQRCENRTDTKPQEYRIEIRGNGTKKEIEAFKTKVLKPVLPIESIKVARDALALQVEHFDSSVWGKAFRKFVEGVHEQNKIRLRELDAWLKEVE